MSEQRFSLDTFDVETFRFQNIAKTVYSKGTGPGVVVLAEMPGIHPLVIRFAERVADAGFKVWLPSLFGDDGRAATSAYTIKTLVRTCIRREFKALAAHQSSPVTDWLRSLAAVVHERCGGPGVGAVGMCFTGNFALNLMLEPAVIAPILSQPRLCTSARFEAYHQALGSAFEPRVLPDASAKQGTGIPPHSVVTHHLVDERGEPTFEALQDMIEFLRLRLAAA
jgi:dienelactone hydrolase